MSAAPSTARVLSDKRSHHRYPIELEVEYKLLGKGRSDLFGCGKTCNISSGGVLFEALESPPAGSTIELMLSWPFLLEGVCPLRLLMRGRVVRNDGHAVAIHSTYHEFRTAGSREKKNQPSNLIMRAK